MTRSIKEIKFGDAIRRLTKALGLPHCRTCEERRKILNEIQKNGIRETVRKLRGVKASGESRSEEEVKEIINKLQECCKNQ